MFESVFRNNIIKLSFDMRHVITPEPQWLRFNTETFWLDLIDNQTTLPTLDYIRENPGLSRQDIIEGVGMSPSTGYRHIDKLLQDDFIKEFEGGLFPIENLQ